MNDEYVAAGNRMIDHVRAHVPEATNISFDQNTDTVRFLANGHSYVFVIGSDDDDMTFIGCCDNITIPLPAEVA